MKDMTKGEFKKFLVDMGFLQDTQNLFEACQKRILDLGMRVSLLESELVKLKQKS